MGSKDRFFDSPNNGSLKSVVPVQGKPLGVPKLVEDGKFERGGGWKSLWVHNADLIQVLSLVCQTGMDL